MHRTELASYTRLGARSLLLGGGLVGGETAGEPERIALAAFVASMLGFESWLSIRSRRDRLEPDQALQAPAAPCRAENSAAPAPQASVFAVYAFAAGTCLGAAIAILAAPRQPS